MSGRLFIRNDAGEWVEIGTVKEITLVDVARDFSKRIDAQKKVEKSKALRGAVSHLRQLREIQKRKNEK